MITRDNRPSPTPHLEDDAFPAPRPFSRNPSRTMRSTGAQSPTSGAARTSPKAPYARTVLHGRRLFSRRRRSVDLIVAIAIVAALAAVASCAFFTWKQAGVYAASQQSGTLNSSNVFESGTSTPKSEWHQGEVPMLFQTDPAWGSNPYAGSDIATAGCGPTCLSMVYVALTGKTDLGPAEMASFSERNGFVQDRVGADDRRRGTAGHLRRRVAGKRRRASCGPGRRQACDSLHAAGRFHHRRSLHSHRQRRFVRQARGARPQ